MAADDSDDWREHFASLPSALIRDICGHNSIDDVAVRWYDADTDGNLAEGYDGAHYYLQDANFNVTAVANASGTVLERYHYTPYGEVTFLDLSFGFRGSSTIGNTHLYTGRERDPETALQLNRHRYYAAHMGRWVNRDAILYEGSQWNLYEYSGGSPVDGLDPSGLSFWDWVPIIATIKHCSATPKGSDPNDFNCQKCQPSARDWIDNPELAFTMCKKCIDAQTAGFLGEWGAFVGLGGDLVRGAAGITVVAATKGGTRAVAGACTGGVLLADAAIDAACMYEGYADIKDTAKQVIEDCCKPPQDR